MRAEWVKFWSVRSTAWAVLALVVVTIGITTLFSWGISESYDQLDASERSDLDPANASLSGLFFGQLVIAVLGALVVTAEYSTRGVRSTFTAVPRRLNVLAAKALVLAVVAFVVGLVTCFVAFFIGQLFFASVDIDVSLGDPGVPRVIIGGALYVVGCGMFGFALGTLLRHSAGAITTAVALLLVVPPLIGLIPDALGGEQISKWFTSNAGTHIMETVSSTEGIGPWSGYAAFTLQWLVLLVIGAWLVKRRDA
nr:ABC transporter permease subunit [Motilibacter deserti]